jgi:putative hemolysin
VEWGLFGELALILLLILLNGFFAGAEIAILTAKRGRLEQLSQEGDRGAKAALKLSSDADRFLPTVQVGITLVGTFAAAFGGASFISEVSHLIGQIPVSWIQQRSETISLGVISIGIAFFSLILGELVPKRVALQNAEFMARWVALPMVLLQTIAQPFVWFLRVCTKSVLLVLGQKTEIRDSVSVEDIQHLIDAGHEAGILLEAEQQMAQATNRY